MYAAMAGLTATIADDVPLVVAALPWARTREAEPHATGRLLVNLGNALGTTDFLYFLTDGLRVGDPEGSLLILTLVHLVATVAATWGGGVLSDRTRRRRVFVAGVFTVLGALSVGRIRSVR
ncbi:MAG: Permease of the major facilitator superfamily [Blastococcus sp.]|nr:Permease of the major facilitator superfamily [Blastococcus sp.]